MPPASTGAIVAAIGLNPAPIAVRGISASGFDTAIGFLTVLAVGAGSPFGRLPPSWRTARSPPSP